MRAVQYDAYGDAGVLHVSEVPEPKARRGGVLVDVEAAALNPKDVLIRKGKFRPLSRGAFPRCCGYDFAGRISDSGQPVFGMVNGMLGRTCAERIFVPDDELAYRPPELSAVEGASLPLAGLTALQALRDDGLLQSGQHTAINGASGGVGTLAIQIAKALGAQVTAICSKKNEELCTSLGADRVLPYDEVDDVLAELSGVDVFFDVFGNRSLGEVAGALAHHATFVSTVPSKRLIGEVARSVLSRRKAKLVLVRSRRRDLDQLARWVVESKLKPVVDRTYPLEDIADAHRYLETRRARGKVVVSVGRPMNVDP